MEDNLDKDTKVQSELKRNLRSYFKRVPRSYLKGSLIAFTSIVVLEGGFLTIKGPSLIKGMAQASLERNLAPLGFKQIEIETINVGWGRFYFRDIRSKAAPSAPSLNIQEMDVAISPFLKVKAVDIVGATLQLKEGDMASFSNNDLKDKVGLLGKTISNIKQLKLPVFAMRDCLLIIPSSQGLLKLPIHAMTETTVTRNQILTVDLGEPGDKKFSGQFVLDIGRKGITIDVHTTNIDFKTPTFQIKAPEISFWGSTGSEAAEGYKLDGFAKLDQLKLDQYGSLKMPLEVNLEGDGTSENLVLDELTIMTTGNEKNILELEGNYKPSLDSGQVILTTQITQLSKLWDFTPLIAAHGSDNVSVMGKVNLTSELLWEKGTLKTSVLALDLKGGAVARDGFSIEGANGQILFNTLKPLTTKGDQRLSATKLSIAGIDLKNLALEYLFDTKGLFQITKFKAEALSGNLKAHRFQRLATATRPAFQFETDFENIELADILKLTDLKNLSGRAKLAGNASMSYGLDDGLDIRQAELHSISDSGVIQYKSGAGNAGGTPLGQGQAIMAFQVLDDLNFTVFNVRLEHSVDNPSEMQGIVKMLGSNPKVLNGYPFEFNIVTTGKLKDLVINTLQHMKPPADLNELRQAIKATKATKEEVKVAKEKIQELPTETKAPKTSSEAPIPLEAKTMETKATEVLRLRKAAKKVRSTKRAKRAKPIKARRGVKSAKKVKRAKATKTVKEENRNISDG